MTKTTEENLSQSKYAEHRNVTKGYIGRLIKEGRLHLIKGKLNVEMSDAELDLKLKQGQLVEVDQVGDHLDKIFSAVRQRLLATPSKIAPLVHAEESVKIRREGSFLLMALSKGQYEQYHFPIQEVD